MVLDTTAVRTKGFKGSRRGSCSSTASGFSSRRARPGGTRDGQSELSTTEAFESESSSDVSDDEDGDESPPPSATTARPQQAGPGRVQTLAQELVARLRHTEELSAGQKKKHQSLGSAEFYSEEGIITRMDLLEKESIKQALEDLWIAANCVDPTDEIIDKQELTLGPNPDETPSPSPNVCPRWSMRQATSPSPSPSPKPDPHLTRNHAGVCDHAPQDGSPPSANGDADRGDGGDGGGLAARHDG